jgi:hypothetical protein
VDSWSQTTSLAVLMAVIAIFFAVSRLIAERF